MNSLPIASLARFCRRLLFMAAALLLTGQGAFAALTDIANAPLFTSSGSSVKPNIMFVLDDSGSMAWNYLPDPSGNFSSTGYGRLSYQCNGVAYNPNVIYTLPVDATGTSVAPAPLTNAIGDPTSTSQVANPRTVSAPSPFPMPAAYVANSTTTTLTVTGSTRSTWFTAGDQVTIFQSGDSSRWIEATVVSWTVPASNAASRMVVQINDTTNMTPGVSTLSSPRVGKGTPVAATYYRYTGSQTKLGYTYNSSGVITTTTFYRECNSAIGSNPGASVFTAVSVSSAEAQNYANWYTYYSTRMQMMKSSISLAFKNMDARYRVGYSTISATDTIAGDNFLDIADFGAAQKASFYTHFNAADPTSSTPLRGALAKAGQYFAKKAPGQAVDPVQYSCQKNFTILSTDGYWNTSWESTTAPKYGPYQLDNSTAVGQQDGSGTLRPMLDGNSVVKSTTSTYTTTVSTVTTVVTPRSTDTSSVRSTVTYTPVSSEFRYSYTFAAPSAQSGRLARNACGTTPCTITVTDTSGHGYSTGDTVTIQTGAGYTGTYAITVLSANTFTYSVPTRPTLTSVTSASYILNTAQGCTSGQTRASSRKLSRDLFSVNTTTLNSSTSTASTATVVTTRTDMTPYKRVVLEVDGTQSTDTTNTNGATVSTNSSTTTYQNSAPVITTSTTSTPGATSYTAFVDVGAGLTPCVTATPSPNPSATQSFATPSSSLPVLVTASSTVPAVLTTAASTTSTVGPTTVIGPVTTTSGQVSSGGTSNSLADVAAYYYLTDLRTSALGNCAGALGSGTDVCNNNVGASSSDSFHSYGDTAAWQHMTTFTLGLGAGGILTYDPNYLNQSSGDFFDIVNGAKTWPVPVADRPEAIDDLWHAAVNGRGQYFSAGDPASLTSSLATALDSIKAITGSASAAAPSSLQPVQGDNDIFKASFTSAKWTGELESYKIDPVTGVIANTPTWKATTQLDAMTPASRTIYYSRGPGYTTLRPFTYSNLTSDGLAFNFDTFCAKTGADGGATPLQCAALNTADKASANSGPNLVSYIAGSQTQPYYRDREHVLGDIISASPMYVGKPSFRYTENGYSSFVSGSTRTGVVYIGANDGMLHALDRVTGNELWAYIPSFVIPKLYKLADTSYPNNHNYYVDGAPVMGDIFVGGAWKTILVGGLNGGGRGYYALDITYPASPKLLWEFSETDLGLTYGNPIITKRADGTWVVVFASGYNNVSTGDGNGHLYVLNANTGSQLVKLNTYTSGTTPAGSTGTPSGLAKINPWIDSELSNSAKRFYGGDLLGNLWRFDIDNLVQPNSAGLLLAQFKVNGTTPQPITTRPQTAEINYNGSTYPVVYVATGRYLGNADLTDTTQQSVYAIKDPLTTATYADIRASSVLVTQTFVAGTSSTGTNIRTSSSNPVNWSTNAGWRADFLGSGERTNINPQLVLNALFVGTNIPSNNACDAGGSSWLYKLDIASGSAISNAADNAAGEAVGNVMIMGLTTVQLTNADGSPGNIITIITRSDGTLQTITTAPPAIAGALKRTSWRELVD